MTILQKEHSNKMTPNDMLYPEASVSQTLLEKPPPEVDGNWSDNYN